MLNLQSQRNSFFLLLGLVLILNFVHKSECKLHIPSFKVKLPKIQLPNLLGSHHGGSKGGEESESAGDSSSDASEDEIPVKTDWRNFDYSVLEKSRPSTIELVSQNGYPIESHVLTTEDGYILTMHRIPHGSESDEAALAEHRVEEYSPVANGAVEAGEDDQVKDRADRDVKIVNKTKVAPTTASINKEAGKVGTGDSTKNVNQSPVKTQGRRPILMLPGYLASSEVWFINSPEKCLPYILASRGYDVWMGNFRGSSYSNNHTTRALNSSEFWDFGFHEMGVLDMPAMIDYILKETGYKKVNYIGHSMGMTVDLILLSTKPEYNDKINMSIGLAPVAHLSHIKSPVVRSLATLLHMIPEGIRGDILKGWSVPFWPRNSFTQARIQETCNNEHRRKWCAVFFFLFMGFDYCQTSMTNFTLMTSIYPAGSSARTGIHFEQLVNTKGFRQFDFGPYHNFIKYGDFHPPSYNLSKITAPHTLFWGDNDWLANPMDVSTLMSELQPTTLKESCRVKFHRFNHIDFLTAHDLNLLVNDRVLRVLHGDSCRQGDQDDDFQDEPLKCNFFQDWNFLLPRGKDGVNPIIEAATTLLESLAKFKPSFLDRLRFRVDYV